MKRIPTRIGVSIHALLAECDTGVTIDGFYTLVSIHALLAECDLRKHINKLEEYVSIHALLAECDFWRG